MTVSEPSLPVVADVVRNGFVESRHRGSLVLVDSTGSVLSAVGDVTSRVLPRSCNKPLQLAAMVRAGLRLGPPELAVAAASHSGEEMHVAVVREILRRHGLSDADLDNTPGLPLSEDAAKRLIRAGAGADRMHQNCSGKHAAMLATCVVNGWPTRGYLEPAHPVQVAIRDGIAEVAAEPVPDPAVDGCGAPLFALTLTGLARAFGRLVQADLGTAERAVADAMRAHPHLVGGTGRDVTEFMRAAPGLLMKDGAEGTLALATASGSGAAVKVADGAARAWPPLAAAVLTALGVALPEGLGRVPVLGHGDPVGAVHARVTLVTGTSACNS